MTRYAIPVVDLALAAMVTGYAAYDVVGNHSWPGPEWVNLVVVTGSCATLAFRRVAPTIVLGCVMAALAGLGAAYGSAQTWSSVFPFVIATYSAAAYSRHIGWVAGILVTGVAVRDLNDPYIQSIRDLDFTGTLTVLTIMAGFEGRRLAARTTGLDQREDDLDREEAARAAAIIATERGRIARELHDIISHGLGVMVLQAGAAEQVLDKNPSRARDALASIRSTGQEAIDEMGTLLDLVREGAESSREPQPRLTDIGALVERMRSTGLDVHYQADATLPSLSPALELSAYRVAQEGLTNAAKYAGRVPVTVDVHCNQEILTVCVNDEGHETLASVGSRRGLIGLAERVAIFGGQFSAGPRREGGWRLAATFPIHR